MAKLIINARYGVVPNKLLTDPSISFKAKGLFAYMQAKPENWDFSSERIVNETKDGIDSVQSALKELVATGYLKRINYKDETGRFQWVHELLETPLRENPVPEKPVLNKTRYIKQYNTRGKPLGGVKPDTETVDLEIRSIIKAFEEIDAKNKTYYGNKTQREACRFMIKEYGKERVQAVIKQVIPQTNKRPRYEFPHVSTPYQLMQNWEKLKDGIISKKVTSVEKNSVAFAS